MLYFGLDKVILKNLKILKIDTTKLNSYRISYSTPNMYPNSIPHVLKLDENTLVTYAKIIDNDLFNDLTFGILNKKGKIIFYTNISLRIRNEEHKHMKNLIPLPAEALLPLCNKLTSYIEDKYGILLDFSDAQFKELEINVTFRTPKSFSDYENMILNLLTFRSQHLRNHDIYYRDSTFTGIKIYNASIAYKVYDKSAQLKLPSNFNYLRIEISFSPCATWRYLSKVFPSTRIDCIDTPQLYQLFLLLLNRDFHRSFISNIIQQPDLLCKKLQKIWHPNSNTWMLEILYALKIVPSSCSDCFDIRILLVAAAQILPTKNKARALATLEERASKDNLLMNQLVIYHQIVDPLIRLKYKYGLM